MENHADKGGEPRTATSTFTQLQSSEKAAVQFSVVLRPLRPYGPLGMGNPGRPPRLSHSS